MTFASHRGLAVLAVTATVFGAGAGFAADHEVLITEGAYFPSLTYAQPGDRLIFINSSDAAQTVTGAEESWSSGPIPIDGSFVLDLAEEIPQGFSGPGLEDGEMLEGSFTFEPAPTTDG
ncbi:hypothetical protein ACFSUD_14930 [Sulfitobacter aestuarii]|uniref:Plastocyanin n=1 Tax=Sulfitobacter aestuarii TaxID=2161676 RepID=A0ABW5U6N9_9RHOB